VDDTFEMTEEPGDDDQLSVDMDEENEEASEPAYSDEESDQEEESSDASDSDDEESFNAPRKRYGNLRLRR
jgi:hypothetical protein